VRAPADGYTLLLVPNAINATLYDRLNFNFIRDIAPVAGINREAHVMVVTPSVPAKTVPVHRVRQGHSGQDQHGIGRQWNSLPCGRRTVQTMTGASMVHVPYRGGGPALVDLLGGQVQVMFPTMSASIEYVRAGKLRALAVTTVTPSETLPQISTVSDFVPGFE
jgi:tripartite-type tricarboxylate transporter receptor subunit TctC